MKESAIAQLLMSSDITESKMVINVRNDDGSTKEVTLKDPEDFLNEHVPQGTTVNLVFSNWRIYTGIYEYIEDEEGEFVLYVKPKPDSPYRICLPYYKLVGYYIDEI